MLLDDIYDVYFKKWSLRNVIFKKISLINKTIFYISVLLILFLINFIIFKLGKINLFRNTVGASFSVILVVYFLHFNHYAKKILSHNFKIESKGIIANFNAFHKFKLQCFREFIDWKYNIFENDDAFKMLLENIDEKITDSKTPYVVDTSIKFAIMGPVWIQFVTYFFQKRATGIEDAILFFTIFSFFLIIIYYFYSMIKSIFDEFTNSYYNNLKSLRGVLKDIKLDKISKKL